MKEYEDTKSISDGIRDKVYIVDGFIGTFNFVSDLVGMALEIFSSNIIV